jgi:hypothetical protein
VSGTRAIFWTYLVASLAVLMFFIGVGLAHR